MLSSVSFHSKRLVFLNLTTLCGATWATLSYAYRNSLGEDEKVVLEVWTDGSVKPEDAVAFAAKILKEQVTIFINFPEEIELYQLGDGDFPPLRTLDSVPGVAMISSVPISSSHSKRSRLMPSGRIAIAGQASSEQS